jgi:two-component sensor histidine kinase
MMAPGQVEQGALFYKECTRCGGLVFNRSDQTTPRGGGLAHNHAVATKCLAADRPFLYVTEFLHRVRNEYTCAISLATRLAARSSNRETKAALAQVIDQVHALAGAHEILRPPLTTALVDLSANLTRLCRAMTSSRLAQRGIELHLTITELANLLRFSSH